MLTANTANRAKNASLATKTDDALTRPSQPIDISLSPVDRFIFFFFSLSRFDILVYRPPSLDMNIIASLSASYRAVTPLAVGRHTPAPK